MQVREEEEGMTKPRLEGRKNGNEEKGRIKKRKRSENSWRTE